MMVFHFFNTWIFLSFIWHVSGFGSNQPKICPNATWNASAITFATSAIVGTNPTALFVDQYNTVYTVNTQYGWIGVWPQGSTASTRNISGGLTTPSGLFVSSTGDAYVDNGASNNRVDKWSLNSTNSTPAMFECGLCSDLFIAINNYLYCCMRFSHKIISKSIDNRMNVWNIMAGTGTSGSTSTTLNNPTEIFVNQNLDLYVADYNNNRIQKFPYGQLNGTTVNTAPIVLSQPEGLAFDADGYMYISDCYNNRIIGSDQYGFRCILGCSEVAGSSSTQLNHPADIRFDTYGNLYVNDYQNSKTQNFMLLSNPCGTATTTTTTTTTSTTTQPLNSSIPIINAISYNQPIFSSLAMWSGNGITFATSTAIGSTPYGIHIDLSNTVYVADRADNAIRVWLAGNNLLTRNITTGLATPYSVFATINGDIYIDNGASNYRVDRWSSNGTGNTTVMTVKSACYGLFIDIINNIYCSMYSNNQVVTKSLNSNSSIWTIAAGTDCSGSTSNTLNQPRGIFVDTSLNLYVADCGNNRVQQFLSNQTVAVTVAGSTSATGTITLSCPSDVKLDGDGYLFIVDSNNDRIVASGPNGFRCIIGCSGSSGSSSSQLNSPSMMSFDSYGNIFVVDTSNSRVQKFTLISNTTYPVSVNQPNFCPMRTWYTDAVTIANSSTVGTIPYGLFVNLNNTLFVVSQQYGRLQLWFGGSSNPSQNISVNLGVSYSVFSTVSGDIYMDNYGSYSRVDKWTMNGNNSAAVMLIAQSCYSLFVDSSNTLYCAMYSSHQIVKKWLLDNGNTTAIAAGTGSAGSAANQLYCPAGVFVDLNFNLYVGDCSNNRIQMFSLGQMNGNTIVGSTVSGTITLSCPNAVVLDANGYLFISDTYNNRIVGSGPNGYRCILGCSGSSGSSPSQLYYPRQMSFDSYGNLYIADQNNNRIQKFILASNSCSISYNQPQLCAQSTWFSNASTIATTTQIGSSPNGLFIDGLNTIYMPSQALNYTLVSLQGSSTMTYVYTQSIRPLSVFVTINGNMYIDNGYANGRVDRFVSNVTTVVMNVNGSCYGLFVDLNNYLYCSMKNFHQVVKLLLNSGTTIPSIAAGTGSPGSTSAMLNSQQGIYVDNSMNLYVADCANNRVQIFQSGQLNGITELSYWSCPTGVVLDSNGYLFVVDSNNHRIVGSSSNGYRCIVGCSGGGSSTSQLLFPQSMAFDSYGNIYVTDRNNSRVQRFTNQQNNCTIVTTTASTTSSTTTTTTSSTTSATTTTTSVTTSTTTTTTSSTTSDTTTSVTTSTTTTTTYSTTSATTTTSTTTNTTSSTTSDTTTSVTTSTTTTTTSTTTSDTTTSVTTSTTTTTTYSTTSATTSATTSTTTTTTYSTVNATNSATTSTTTTTTSTTTSDTTTSVTTSTTTTTTYSTTSATTSETISTTTTKTYSATSATTSATTSTTTITTSSITSATTEQYFNQTCYSPTITLIPGGSSFMSPLQYRRSEDFSISSMIQFNCDTSLSTTIRWTIKNCTSTTCSNQIQLNQNVPITYSELYIPEKTLSYGVYQLTISVTMTDASNLKSSSSAYVHVTATDIIVNVIELGTSMITHGYNQDLFLDPGSFSVDPDEDFFDANKWKYEYYCRIYPFYNFPSIQGVLLPLNDLQIDPNNPSCLSNHSNIDEQLIYSNSTLSPKSSLTVRAGSLQPNRVYQLMVYLENKNASIQATGYVLISIDQTMDKLIAISCVLSTLCPPNLEYQLVSPTTQVALYSICIGNCSTLQTIQWNIYQGIGGNSSSTNSSITWILFSQMNAYENIWFFGQSTSNFTAINQLFLHHSEINYWRFESVYTFPTGNSSSSLNFILNYPPTNGSCSIFPLNGTTTTLFTISCPNWFDNHGIKDYLLFSWTDNIGDQLLIAYSPESTFQVYLPCQTNESSTLHLIVNIRDYFYSITQVNLTSVTVTVDWTTINSLIKSTNNLNDRNEFIRLLSSGNQNVVGQIMTILSQQYNQINEQHIQQAISNGIPAISISISSLTSQTLSQTNEFNQTVFNQYVQELNSQANIRDNLIEFLTNLPITTINSIKLQASSLNQLTQSTNQLTRNVASLSIEKVYQLAVNLYSFTTQVPYEDIQTASIQILQCTTNILTAINSPLQERSPTLDLDLSRATIIPTDYDTDLESEWAHIGTMSTNDRNIYFQKQTANQIEDYVQNINDLITASLKVHLNLGQNLTINSSQLFAFFKTISIQSLENQTNSSSIFLRSLLEPLAPYADQSNTNLSRLLSFSYVDQNGNEIPVQTNLNQSIHITIPRDPNLVIPQMNLQNVTSINSSSHHLIFNYHYVNITSSLPVSVHIEMQPSDLTLSYLFIFKFDQKPQLNTSIQSLDGWTLFCSSNLPTNELYTYFLDNQKTENHQSLIFALRELSSEEVLQYCSHNSSKSTIPIKDQSFNFTSDYSLRIYQSGCYYFNFETHVWQSDGLTVGSSTTYNHTECFSTHLTSFAGGFLVLPNPINWNYVFANMDFMKNKTIYLTIIIILILYILLMIYARYKDKKDFEKLGVTLLADNNRSDRYYYQILVFTGHRKNAGTKSKVQFILSGDDDQTQVRTLSDSHRSILERGDIDAFVMTVPKCLGLLNYLRIWHDNSGQGESASWFLKYIIVRDLQTMQKFYFIAQRWFAVEKDDGRIERTLPVAGELEKNQFSYILSKKTYHNISDSHLWFSIFSHPPSIRFTRTQRCTCCFVLLFTSMVLNIMYYDLAADANSASEGLNVGPLIITPQQIGIGVMVELFSLVPSLLIVQFFRCIRSRQQTMNKLNSSIAKTLPWWCLYIAYTLSFLIMIVSIFFIIVRGIEFGDLKSQQWLTSIVSGFFSSVFLTQPLKIIAFAFVVLIFCRNQNDEKEENVYIDDKDFEFHQDNRTVYPSLVTSQISKKKNRLNENEVQYARKERLKEIQMWSILRQVCMNIIFLVLILCITNSTREQNSFLQVQHFRSYFLNQQQANLDFTQISTIDDYWIWLEDYFVDTLRAQNWYNNDIPRYLNGYLNDKTNRLIGWATMRQLRIKSQLCSDQRIIRICQDDYSLMNEEKQSFSPGWTMNKTINNEYSSTIIKAFQYQTSDELDTYAYVGEHETYSGNGYVYEFRGSLVQLQSNLSVLHQLEWIDEKTRAVIIQLTLYNPNVQLFTSVTILVEFLSTGSIDPSARFEPLNFYAFTSVLQLVCIIIYLFLIIYLMIKEIQKLFRLKSKYFYEFWSLIQFGIIVCSWAILGIYVWHLKESNRISQLFRQTNGYSYINLQLSAYVNDLLIIFQGFCCFFGMIKFIDVISFIPRLRLFTLTLTRSTKSILGFFLMFSIIFMAFLCLFYLLFVSLIFQCADLLSTAQLLFEMTLLKFSTSEFISANAFLGPFCFFLFIFLVVFICLNMFMSIIMDSFRYMRANQNVDEEEILLFMWKRFLHWTRLKRPTANEIQEERDRQMRSQYLDSIESFPQRIDQLFDALNRIYIDQQTELARLERTKY